MTGFQIKIFITLFVGNLIAFQFLPLRKFSKPSRNSAVELVHRPRISDRRSQPPPMATVRMCIKGTAEGKTSHSQHINAGTNRIIARNFVTSIRTSVFQDGQQRRVFEGDEASQDGVEVDLVGAIYLALNVSPEVLGGAAIRATRQRPTGRGGGGAG